MKAKLLYIKKDHLDMTYKLYTTHGTIVLEYETFEFLKEYYGQRKENLSLMLPLLTK